MSDRLDNRPFLYGQRRLTDAQVRTLEILASYACLKGATVNAAFVKTLGGNPRSLQPLADMHLAVEEEPGWWKITSSGIEMLREIRKHAE